MVRSLSQNSSVLPEEEDEKSSESENCRHKLVVNQREVGFKRRQQVFIESSLSVE